LNIDLRSVRADLKVGPYESPRSGPSGPTWRSAPTNHPATNHPAPTN